MVFKKVQSKLNFRKHATSFSNFWTTPHLSPYTIRVSKQQSFEILSHQETTKKRKTMSRDIAKWFNDFFKDCRLPRLCHFKKGKKIEILAKIVHSSWGKTMQRSAKFDTLKVNGKTQKPRVSLLTIRLHVSFYVLATADYDLNFVNRSTETAVWKGDRKSDSSSREHVIAIIKFIPSVSPEKPFQIRRGVLKRARSKCETSTDLNPFFAFSQ